MTEHFIHKKIISSYTLFCVFSHQKKNSKSTHTIAIIKGQNVWSTFLIFNHLKCKKLLKMFKKLKDKIAEEVKSSPSRIQQLAQVAQVKLIIEKIA